MRTMRGTIARHTCLITGSLLHGKCIKRKTTSNISRKSTGDAMLELLVCVLGGTVEEGKGEGSVMGELPQRIL